MRLESRSRPHVGKRLFVFVVATCVHLLGHAAPTWRTFDALMFEPPSGWKEDEAVDRVTFTHIDQAKQRYCTINIFASNETIGDSIADFNAAWRGIMKQSQSAVVPASAPLQLASGIKGRAGSGEVRIGDVASFSYLFAVNAGPRTAYFVAVASNRDAFNSCRPQIDAVLASVKLKNEGTPAISSKPPPATAKSVAGRGEPLPKSEVVNGKPQGLFAGVGVVSGDPVFLLFLPGGRAYRGVLRDGMSNIDWAALEAADHASCGKWLVTGGNLRVVWNDGVIWDGPLKLTKTGIQFRNEGYDRVVSVAANEMAGSWESVRSTAWLNMGRVGPSTTQVNNLVVDGSGNFTFASAIGAVIKEPTLNRKTATSYGESNQRGKLTIEGYDAVFHYANGTSVRMSIGRFAGGNEIILLDGIAFLRQ